jgi:hypothetical protein
MTQSRGEFFFRNINFLALRSNKVKFGGNENGFWYTETLLYSSVLHQIWIVVDVNFDSLKRKILTVRKEKFWQFEKGKFWQFGKKNFDSSKMKILTVRKWKFWQFWKGLSILDRTMKESQCTFHHPRSKIHLLIVHPDNNRFSISDFPNRTFYFMTIKVPKRHAVKLLNFIGNGPGNINKINFYLSCQQFNRNVFDKNCSNNVSIFFLVQVSRKYFLTL